VLTRFEPLVGARRTALRRTHHATAIVRAPADPGTPAAGPLIPA
jgi:hypothetical protein